MSAPDKELLISSLRTVIAFGWHEVEARRGRGDAHQNEVLITRALENVQAHLDALRANDDQEAEVCVSPYIEVENEGFVEVITIPLDAPEKATVSYRWDGIDDQASNYLNADGTEADLSDPRICAAIESATGYCPEPDVAR